MDRLIVNARMITLDPAVPSASAIAIRSGRFAAVGEGTALLAQRDRDTEVVDLGGRTVVPGLIDAHIHLPRASSSRSASTSARSTTGSDSSSTHSHAS